VPMYPSLLNSQTAPNTASVTPSVAGLPTDPTQLALFQQLARATNAGGSVATAGSNQRVPVPMSVVPPSANIPPVASPVGGPSQAYPYHDDRRGFARREPYNDRFNAPPRGREPFDNRDQRGGFRGAPRGRGRGRWDDRQPDRNRGPDWRSPPPPGRNMQSRSRSPVGRQGRNTRPYSPSRKQPYRPSASTPPRYLPPSNDSGGEKDEFGRDIRPHSPHEDSPAPTPGAADLSPSRSGSIPTEEQGSTIPDATQPGVALPSTSQIMPPSTTPFVTAEGGLDSFDLTSFDPTAPASWERLGKAWNTTHGYMPSQEELMQYVMTMNTPNTFPIVSQYEETPVKQWPDNQYNGWARGGQRRGGRGFRGSYGRGHEYGNGRGGFGGRGRQFEQDTDALTLVGGDDSAQYTVPVHDGSHEQNAYYGSAADENSNVESSGNSGGHMEKVGDGWVWKEAAGVA
jgi:protein NRD1